MVEESAEPGDHQLFRRDTACETQSLTKPGTAELAKVSRKYKNSLKLEFSKKNWARHLELKVSYD